MAVQRAWDWDLDELRSAGATLDDHDRAHAPENMLSAEPLPNSGYVPINKARHLQGDEDRYEKNHSLTEINAAVKAKASKRRKMQPSITASASKPRKAPASRKTRKSKTAGYLQCQDISKGLSRTKPMTSALGAQPAKTVSPADIILREQRHDAELMQDAIVAFEAQYKEDALNKLGQSCGLSKTYQAAYANPGPGKIDGNNSNLVDQVLANKDLTVTNGDVACKNVAFPSEKAIFCNEISNQCEPWDEAGEVIPPEFIPPPSAQGENMVGLVEVFPTASSFQHTVVAEALSKTHVDNEGICRKGENADEFPIEDEDLEAMMQSEVRNAASEGYKDDSRRQDLSDGYSVDDDNWEACIPQFSDRVPDPDIVAPHKENPNAPVGNRMTSYSSQITDSQSSCVLIRISGNAGKAKQEIVEPLEGSENCFDDADLDEELMELPDISSDTIQPSTSLTSPAKPSSPKLQWLPPKVYTPAKSSQIPASPTDVPHLVPFNINGEPLPFTRPPFPKSICDRSPILGLSNRTVLRTCFRIGEALNAAAVASRANTDAVIELYAHVVHSEREPGSGFKQFFQFGDLFTDKPPYLSATYSLWKGVGLWEVDSRVFLEDEGKGKMARVLGRVKKRERGGGCEMIVLSIWEVDWEDVGVAKGIVC